MSKSSLENRMVKTRLALQIEGLWKPFLQLGCVLLLFIAAAWFNIFDSISLIFHLLLLSLFVAAAGYSIYSAFRLPKVQEPQVLSRLNEESGLSHKPFTTLQDINVNATPLAKALWEAEKTRLAKLLREKPAAKPRFLSETFDGYAIRAIAGLLFVTSFFFAGDERASRLTSPFDFNKGNSPNWRADVWMTPPQYTGLPSKILLSMRAESQFSSDRTIGFVEGSKLFVKSDGLKNFKTTVSEGLEFDKDGYLLKQDATLTLKGLPKQNASQFTFSATKDLPPTITFHDAPSSNDKQHLTLSTRIGDDYGVLEAQAHFTLSSQLKVKQTLAPNPLFELPPLSLGLPPRGATGVVNSSHDLSTHPLAGESLMLHLTAKDDLGQSAQSAAMLVKLPAKTFRKPLALALLEQRTLIALDTNNKYKVLTSLQYLMLAPHIFTRETAQYLGLRTAFNKLLRARDNAQFQSVNDYLYEIALFIEEGTMSDTQRNLKNAQDALKDAIDKNAPQDEIAKLMQALREAMNKMMSEMAKQLREQGQQAQRPTDPQNRMSQQNINDIMKQIEELMRQGAFDQARRLLEELQKQMQAMQEALEDGRLTMEQGDPSKDRLSELSDMIRREQDLRDETFKNQQENGQKGEELSKQQEALRKKLEELNKDGEPNEGLGEAENDMGKARDALKEGKGREAMEAQRRALQNLQKGAQAENEKQRGQAGNNDPNGQPQPNAQARDPLGREAKDGKDGNSATGNNGGASAFQGQSAGERAGKILDELRKRAGERARGALELDYIERLLKGLK